MEKENLPIIAKKFWKIVRVMYFLLRKGISKVKLFADLNLMMNRAKITGKLASIQNLMFHHHHHTTTKTDHHISYPVPLNGYEFSCNNSPAFPALHFPFHLSKRKTSPTDGVLMAAAFEMVKSATASPALPGFGATPLVRQLRITDSPFPLRDVDADSHVDEAAEEFIMKFHRDLRHQNAMAFLGHS